MSGFDLSPWLRIAMMGLSLALGPLAWVWIKHRHHSAPNRLRALTLLTLFLTFDLVLFGAFTRLTDSGLGCPDWPGCYGHASPIGAQAPIALAQQALPTGPVTESKAWIEMLHRYMATGVGVLIVTLNVARWREAASGTPLPSAWWSAATLLAVCVQGAFGAFTVTMKLFPAVVTLHLLGGLTLVALLAHQAAKFTWPGSGHRTIQVRRSHFLGWQVAAGLLIVQIALGGWVSANYAVLACQDVPLCQGQWWPEMNFEQAYSLWRPLGHTPAGDLITFAALTAIHVVHRLGAVVALLALIWTAYQWWRYDGLRRPGQLLAGLLGMQLLTGLSNVVLGWPLLAALAHTGGAAAMVGLLAWILARAEPCADAAQTDSLTQPRGLAA